MFNQNSIFDNNQSLLWVQGLDNEHKGVKVMSYVTAKCKHMSPHKMEMNAEW